MRVYTVHIRKPTVDIVHDVIFVREGFNWCAFLFSALWALVNRLWLVAMGLLLLESILQAAFVVVKVDVSIQLLIGVGLAILFGFFANDFRRWNLSRRHYAETDVIVAENEMAAERRFWERRPELVAGQFS